MSEQDGLVHLSQAIGDTEQLAIYAHNDPDPDAIASAAALQFLLARHFNTPATIWYNGIIGRAENRALVNYLGRTLNLIDGPLPPYPALLVDTQPGAGNNPLPPDAPVLAVFDHHPLRTETASAAFSDVRPQLGACATILTLYLQAAQLAPDPPLATALFYGLKTDTLALGRNAQDADIAVYVYLQGLVNTAALMNIEQAQVPPAYFHSYSIALRAARIYDDILVADVGPISYPDLVAELADWLMRLEGVGWAICIGTYNTTVRLAIRTRQHHSGAGQAAQAIIGEEGLAGGHGHMAGGQVPLNGSHPAVVARRLRRRALDYFKVSPAQGRRLMKLS